jgi:hypothetical protein
MQLKNMTFTTDLVLRIFCLIPAPVFHNLGKARALKISFWHLAIDQIDGAYVEFGVASGNSMRSAELSSSSSYSKSLGVKHIERNLYGFDTFASFSSDKDEDNHPTWDGENFSVSIDQVSKRFKRQKDRVKFFKLDATKIDSHTVLDDYVPEDSIAIALLDMDLGSPTAYALNWIRPKLKSGSIIIFDEFMAFKGDPILGESGAYSEFLRQNPEITSRVLTTYGDGGIVNQITINE